MKPLLTYCNHNDDAIMMMMMMELELILTELRPFELSHFRQCLHCGVWSLCSQLLLQFSMDVIETMSSSCGHNDMHVGF